MSFEPKPRNGQTNENTNGAAAAPPAGSASGSVLFHPLCVPRLETAIRRKRQALAAASRDAASGIEKSIGLLAQDSTGLGAAQLTDLKLALSRGLRALEAIDTVATGPMAISASDAAALEQSVTLLLAAASEIAGRR